MLEHIILGKNKNIRHNIKQEHKQELLDTLKDMQGKWFKKKIGKRTSFYKVIDVCGLTVKIKRNFEYSSISVLHQMSYYSSPHQYPPSTNLFTWLNKLEPATEEDIMNKEMELL